MTNAPVTLVITNKFSTIIKVCQFGPGSSLGSPSNTAMIEPGAVGYLGIWFNQSGYVAVAASDNNVKWNASRLEYYTDSQGLTSIDVSYIAGRNAAMSIDDGRGNHKGDHSAIWNGAPDEARCDFYTIAGWYDGSQSSYLAGEAYMRSVLPPGGAYLKPDDDRLPGWENPMTMAEDPSRTYYCDFGPP